MSKYGKLRFQNLPGKYEAIALYKLLTGRNSQLNCPENTDITPLICNAFVNAVAHGHPLNLQLSGQVKKLFLSKVQLIGLEHLILPELKEVDFGLLKVHLEHILTSNAATPDRGPGWKQFFRKVEQLSYGDFVATHGALGEKPLFAIIEALIELRSNHTNALASHQSSQADFDFSANEYWHLRGRVHQGSMIFKADFEQLTELNNLHPVFFDMYRPEEAKAVITETANRLLLQLHHINESFQKWIMEYKHAYLQKESMSHYQIRDEVFALQMDIGEFLNRSKNVNSKPGWFSFSPQQNAIEEEKAVLVKAFDDILLKVKELDHAGILPCENMTDLTLIHNWLEEFLKNSHAFRRSMKKAVDKHLSKLNGHNIKLVKFSEQYFLIQNRVRSFLNDINGLQLFENHIEDNTLDVQQQVDWLKSLESRLITLRTESDKIVPYLQWRQFTCLMTSNDTKVIDALKPHPAHQWTALFELWYLQNFIETQDLSPVNADKQLMQAMKLAEHLMKDEWANTIQTAMSQTAHSLKKAMKENKLLKAWMNSTQILTPEIQERIHETLQGIIPITMGQLTKADQVVWHLSNQSEEWSPGNCTIEINHESGDPTYINSPYTKSQLLHSIHSERIHGVKAISNYLISLPGQFEIWQNSKEVILSFLDNHMNDFIFPMMAKDMQRNLISDHRQADEVIEALINNHNRRFSICLGQNDQWTSDSWSDQVAKLHLAKICRKAGFDVSYISWASIFENAELMAFLRRESTTSRPAQSISA